MVHWHPGTCLQELDTDSSGTVSFDELSSGLRKQGYVLADSEIEQLVSE
jgi:calcium-dependent protein kinase